MLIKAFYKTVRGIFNGDGHKDEIVVPVWEFAAVIIAACTILYLMMCDSNILESAIF